MRTRVLVVDDDRLVADTLCLIYQANGFESEARYSAADAFECAKAFAPALILCDVSMPEESGIQFADRLNTAMPETQVMLFTAYATSAAHARAYGERTRRPLKVLSKPCRPDDLLRETRALLLSA